uniref:Uncharacterized protein n=1 Tax=Arundo donax TaxID=35708 RepID=A0A0A9BAN5_ARUDO
MQECPLYGICVEKSMC